MTEDHPLASNVAADQRADWVRPELHRLDVETAETSDAVNFEGSGFAS
jgi:hypothetical protein